MATNQSQKEWQNTAIRIPRDMHSAIHEAAKRDDRSFNGQVVAILRAALQQKQEVAQ